MPPSQYWQDQLERTSCEVKVIGATARAAIHPWQTCGTVVLGGPEVGGTYQWRKEGQS